MSSAQERTSSYAQGAQGQDAPAQGAHAQAGGAQRQAGSVPEHPAGYGEPGYERGSVAGYYDDGGSIAAGGFTALAATLMILSGLWSFFVGITGVLQQSFYLAVPHYTFNYSIHAWGWTHLILGAVVFAAGACLLLGMMWARVVGIVLAVISGLANFLFLPHYPIWSIIVIALDVFIIWALATGDRRRAA